MTEYETEVEEEYLVNFHDPVTLEVKDSDHKPTLGEARKEVEENFFVSVDRIVYGPAGRTSSEVIGLEESLK